MTRIGIGTPCRFSHFVAQALGDGHKVRVLARLPGKLAPADALEVLHCPITDPIDTDGLVESVDFVLQKEAKINTAFVKRIVPAIRRQGVTRSFYHTGLRHPNWAEHVGLKAGHMRRTRNRSVLQQAASKG